MSVCFIFIRKLRNITSRGVLKKRKAKTVWIFGNHANYHLSEVGIKELVFITSLLGILYKAFIMSCSVETK